MLESKLNANCAYIQQNMGGLLVSSLTSFVFSPKKQEGENLTASDMPALPVGGLALSDYLSIGKSMLPHLWVIAKPVLISWGIGKVQSLLIHKLFGKKKMK